MSRLILIQEDDYERQYRESMNYLNSKYHDQPTKLKNIPFSESDALDLPSHNTFDRFNQQNAQSHRNTPLGKLVI
jgi:hypothetical protein